MPIGPNIEIIAAMSVQLYGYKNSVYSWIARFALHEKAVEYEWQEVNPFSDDVPKSYLKIHPFCRVPALVNDGFALYETNAITRYIDEAFPGKELQPADPEGRARVAQIISIVDNYVYWPLVRQVFAHDVMAHLVGRYSDKTEICAGLELRIDQLFCA